MFFICSSCRGVYFGTHFDYLIFLSKKLCASFLVGTDTHSHKREHIAHSIHVDYSLTSDRVNPLCVIIVIDAPDKVPILEILDHVVNAACPCC